MINPLRAQLANLLNQAARAGIKKMDKDSAAACDLKTLDLDAVLKEDIDKICSVITFPEAGKIISAAARLKLGAAGQNRIKDDLKVMARKIVERAEKEKGSLKMPPSCRKLLFRL